MYILKIQLYVVYADHYTPYIPLFLSRHLTNIYDQESIKLSKWIRYKHAELVVVRLARSLQFFIFRWLYVVYVHYQEPNVPSFFQLSYLTSICQKCILQNMLNWLRCVLQDLVHFSCFNISIIFLMLMFEWGISSGLLYEIRWIDGNHGQQNFQKLVQNTCGYVLLFLMLLFGFLSIIDLSIIDEI